MAEKITSNIGFEKQIGHAACALRGSMDASEYKHVILGLIFLKYISDRFEFKYNKLKAEGDGFEEDTDSNLQTILDNHHDLAVCYAMKEEMCDLFKLTDPAVAEKGWINWFSAARSSGIPALVKFAELKE